MSKMTTEQEKGIFKAAVVVNDEAGLPNYMTMFYMEPGTCKPEDVPEVFKVNGEIMAAILISQYTNTVINGIPVSLPYQKPVESMGHDESAAACRRKGPGWHLMTNAEWVYLMKDAAAAGHIISGNTSYGGVEALGLDHARSYVNHSVSFRSALYLKDWKLVTDLLGRA